MENIYMTLPFISHTLIGFYFIFFGIWNVYNWRSTMEVILHRHFPHPWLFLSIGIAWQMIAGFMIVLNVYIKMAALSLIPFTLIAIYLFYPFWKFKAEHRVFHFTLFTANLTMTVGALTLLLNTVTPITQLSDLLR